MLFSWWPLEMLPGRLEVPCTPTTARAQQQTGNRSEGQSRPHPAGGGRGQIKRLARFIDNLPPGAGADDFRGDVLCTTRQLRAVTGHITGSRSYIGPVILG